MNEHNASTPAIVTKSIENRYVFMPITYIIKLLLPLPPNHLCGIDRFEIRSIPFLRVRIRVFYKSESRVWGRAPVPENNTDGNI